MSKSCCLRCEIIAAIERHYPGDIGIETLIAITQALAHVTGETLAHLNGDNSFDAFVRLLRSVRDQNRLANQADETGGVH